MWPLRQNVHYNKRDFFKEIFIFVLIMHLILLGLLFVCDTGKFHQERFDLHTHNVGSTVVFMPLQKRVEHHAQAHRADAMHQGFRKIMSYSEYEKKLANKKNQTQKIEKKAKSAAIIKSIIAPMSLPVQDEAVQQSPTILQQDTQQQVALEKALAEKERKQKADALAKKVAEAKAKKDAAAKKAIAEKAAKEKAAAAQKKKIELEKLAQAKALADQKKIAVEKEKALLAKKAAEEEKKLFAEKKLQEQKEVAAKKKKDEEKLAAEKIEATKQQEAEKKVESQPSSEKQPNVESEEIIASSIESVKPESNISEVAASKVSNEQNNQSDSQDDDADMIDLDHISFVGSRDREMLQIKEQIQAEIVKYYKPPVGIEKKAVCELAVVIGFDGKATRVAVKKSSGSMANDMCARAALLKVPFPKEIIGKEITVALGQ